MHEQRSEDADAGVPASLVSLREAVETLACEVLARAAVTRPPVDIDAIAACEGMRYVPIPFSECLGAYCPGERVGRRFRGGPFAFIGSHQHRSANASRKHTSSRTT